MSPILHLVRSLEMGGLEKWVINFVQKIKGSEFMPIVCCVESRGDLAASLQDHNIPVITLDKRARYDLTLLGKLAKIMRTHQITLLHTHNWDAQLYGTPAAKIARIPVVIHTQHGRLQQRSWKNDLLRPILGRTIDQFIGVSEEVSQFAKQSGWVPKEKIMTITNGVDPSPYLHCAESTRMEIRRTLAIPMEAPVAIHVARMYAIKDQNTLIAAFRTLKVLHPECHLILVGDGPLAPLLKETVLQEGMEKSVHFLGVREDIPALLHAADLFVLSSLKEGISLSLLEAMCAGLPVVATNVGGNPSVVIHEKTGLLVPPQNSTEFAHAVHTLLQQPARAKTMGEEGRARALRDFSFDQMMTDYMELYRKYLNKKRTALP